MELNTSGTACRQAGSSRLSSEAVTLDADCVNPAASENGSWSQQVNASPPIVEPASADVYLTTSNQSEIRGGAQFETCAITHQTVQTPARAEIVALTFSPFVVRNG
ncbi:hypothetical protein ACFVWF_27915 [Rhodococcus qingshengii]|uniref:hypothetical protein n=1 Tax=Rhodococcus qingshengii TaxID=334542 RepID=UPI0036DE375E